jgi:hypothetical protein
MIMEKHITQNGIKYELRGELYYPLLEIPKQTEYYIGKYGRLHLGYIKKHRKCTYTTLLTDGTLNSYLHEIDEQSYSMLKIIVDELTKERGIDEELKAYDMLKWIAEMNNIKACAEEIVLREVVYK